MPYTEEQREQTIAMIHLGTYGSTTYPPTQWDRWKWSEDGAPEWLTASDLDGNDPEQCVTVLDYSLSEPAAPEGWERVYQYAAGEHECPDCRPDDKPEEFEGQPKRSECSLCEGDGYIYSGEECQVVVFSPAYVYGSGMVGCLYDYGPERCSKREDAIEAFLELFGDALEEGEEEALREALKDGGAYYFKDPSAAGAHYCEVS